MFLSFRKDGRVTLVKRRPKTGCGCGTVLACLLVLIMLAYVPGVSKKCSSDRHEKEPVPAQNTKSQKKKKTKKKQPEPPPFRVGQVVSVKEPQPVFRLPGPIFVYQAYMEAGREYSAVEMVKDLQAKGECVIFNEHWELEVLEIKDAQPWVVRFRALNAKAEWWAAADWLKATE